jgi:signal transduction histidine kinase/CheY-like chemotaxis protein
VLTVNHPQEGVRILENQSIDLLLVDIRMPTMDGFELLVLARQQQPNIAVVIMTGYGTVETAVESLHRGADGMILKPFSGAELVQSIERALQDRRRESEILRLQTLRPLFAISESLIMEKSPERLQARLLEIVIEHLQCSHASFYQWDTSQGCWQKLSEKGTPFDLSSYPSSQWGELEETTACLVDKLEDSELTKAFRRLGIRLVICMPLNFGELRQFLFAIHDANAPALGEAEMETLRILSRQALIALENAQLYDELQDRMRQIEESQQALIQAEKMAAVGRLTASIAHEINNPLHSIRNCLHLAERLELPEKDRHEYLELASEEMDRLMHTVRQMLDFYRPSARDRKPVNINEVIDKVLKLLDTQLIENKISVHRDFGDNLPLVSIVDNQIQQVLFNLILNAMEAMPNGGQIYIITIVEQDTVAILVEDTGPGVEEEHREEIFEPFVSSKEKGLGLGLTVSYGVVTAHGGTLTLLHPREYGACFKLSLPVYGL